jgi:hypothetical protein
MPMVDGSGCWKGMRMARNGVAQWTAIGEYVAGYDGREVCRRTPRVCNNHLARRESNFVHPATYWKNKVSDNPGLKN